MAGPAQAHHAPHHERQPTIRPAPGFTLTSQGKTPVSLRDLQSFDADVEGWSFLTCDSATVHEVGRKYGVIAMKKPDGDVDHSCRLIDPASNLRVQYLGTGFDLEEFWGDLLSLVDEAK